MKPWVFTLCVLLGSSALADDSDDDSRRDVRRMTLYVNFDPYVLMDQAWKRRLERDWFSSHEETLPKTNIFQRAGEEGRQVLRKSARELDERIFQMQLDITVIVMEDPRLPSPAVCENNIRNDWVILPRDSLPVHRFWVEYIHWWHLDYMKAQMIEWEENQYYYDRYCDGCEHERKMHDLMWRHAEAWCEANGAFEVWSQGFDGTSWLRHKDDDGCWLHYDPWKNGFVPPPAVAWKPIQRFQFPENPLTYMVIKGKTK